MYFRWCHCLCGKWVTETKIRGEVILWIPFICSSTGSYQRMQCLRTVSMAPPTDCTLFFMNIGRCLLIVGTHRFIAYDAHNAQKYMSDLYVLKWENIANDMEQVFCSKLQLLKLKIQCVFWSVECNLIFKPFNFQYKKV